MPSPQVVRRKRLEILRKKIRFERLLFSEFRKWQRKVYDAFIEQKRTGSSIVVIPSLLRKELSEILVSHYYRVAEAFVPGLAMGEIKSSYSGQPLDGDNPEQESSYTDFLLPAVLLSIRNSMKDQIALTLPYRVKNILSTNEKAGNESTVIVNRNPDITYDNVLAGKLASKTKTVSITETTWVAESVMASSVHHTTPILPLAGPDELKDLQKISPSVTLGEIDVDEFFSISLAERLIILRSLMTPKKTWVSMHDNRVRDTHIQADGQTVPVDEPFTLGGGLLMYPTDQSLGVSFSEVVNCRCWAMYF